MMLVLGGVTKMELITIKCPSCKGELHVNSETLNCFCMYCRSEIKINNTNHGIINSNSLLKRGFLSLEFSDWAKAIEVFEHAANIEPENPQIWIGLLLAELELTEEKDLALYDFDLNLYTNYKKALRFADSELSSLLIKYNDFISKVFRLIELEDWTNAEMLLAKALSDDYNNAKLHVAKLLVELEVKNIDNLSNVGIPFTNNSNYNKALELATPNLRSKLEYLNDKNNKFILTAENDKKEKQDAKERWLENVKRQEEERSLSLQSKIQEQNKIHKSQQFKKRLILILKIAISVVFLILMTAIFLIS